jgi:hypothetical protein
MVGRRSMPGQKANSSSAKGPSIQDGSSLLEFLKSVGAAVVAAAALATASRTLLPEGTWLELFVPIASATGLLIACLHVTFARSGGRYSAHGRGLAPSTKRAFRYGHSLRTFCSAGAVALTIVIGIQLWNAFPNVLTRQSYVVGFVCSTSGAPVTNGTVDVLSSLGTVVSSETQRLDDRGFFYSRLQRWALAPRHLRITVPSCGGIQRLSLSTTEPGVCVSRSQTALTGIRDSEWVLPCEEK